MFSLCRRLVAPVAVMMALARAGSAEEALDKAVLAKLGKAATALVEIKAADGRTRGHGSAFCIHPTGLFVTNEHVVRSSPADGELHLILDAGQESQKILKAKVVRLDQNMDLALLRVDAGQIHASLGLGSIDKLAELTELICFGFPLGTQPASDKKSYPAISIHVGRVTALRKKDGELDRLEMDAVLGPGHSGGPVLDGHGKVTGVIVSATGPGARISQAIPVNRLARFVTPPEFQFSPPALGLDNIHKPVEFQVRVTSVLPSAMPPVVELVLAAGEEKERRVKMSEKDDVYRVSAVPVSQAGPRRLEMAVRFESGSLAGTAADRSFEVGGQKLKLSEVSRLQLQAQPRVVRTDGQVVEGAISGLDNLEVLVGGQAVPVPLAKALTIQVLSPIEISEVFCTFIASQDGKEIGRYRATVPIAGKILPAADPSKVAITAPALGEDRVVKRMPVTVADVSVGGAGRYLVLHLPRLKKLGVFDVNEARITHYIPLAEDKVAFAAGLDKMTVGLAGSGILERWNLATGEKELTVTVSLKEEMRSVIMGSASHGPVVVNGVFMDLQTLKPLPIKYPSGPNAWVVSGKRIPVSADGTVFSRWDTGGSPGSMHSAVFQGDELKCYFAYGSAGRLVPGPDGRTLFTAQGLYTEQLKPQGTKDRHVGYCLPAVQGPFFLSLTPAKEPGKGGGLSLHLLGNDRPLVKLAEFDHGLVFDGWDRDEFSIDKRIFFIPRAQLIVVLPATMDQLVLRRFDVEAALMKSGIDYLIVTSQPPPAARKGDTYDYQLVAKSKQGAIRYRLDSGPPGMSLAAGGKLTWKVLADFAEREADVIISIADGAGQECFHTFKISVRD